MVLYVVLLCVNLQPLLRFHQHAFIVYISKSSILGPLTHVRLQLGGGLGSSMPAVLSGVATSGLAATLAVGSVLIATGWASMGVEVEFSSLNDISVRVEFFGAARVAVAHSRAAATVNGGRIFL